MKTPLKHYPATAEVLRRTRLAAVRFALREAGALLRAGARLVVRAGESSRA